MKIKKIWNWLKYLNEINHGLLITEFSSKQKNKNKLMFKY